MLFSYAQSNKRIKAIGFGLAFNLIGFIAFTFFLNSSLGLGIIFLGAFFMNVVLFIQKYKNKAQFDFYENEIHVHTLNETKIIPKLALLSFDAFNPVKNAKEHTHLLTTEGEYTFIDDGDDNYEEVKSYLEGHIEPNPSSKYHYHVRTLKERIPSLLFSLVLLLIYVFYFDPDGLGNTFLKVFLFLQGGTLLIQIIQWFNFKRKIKLNQ